MDFEPFHSSEDEDANIIKKKDSEKRKRKIKAEKKERPSFDLSPLGARPKQIVHGVVGPADYLEQGNHSNTENVSVSSNKPQPPAYPLLSPTVKSLSRNNDNEWPSPNHQQQHSFPSSAHNTQPASPMFPLTSKIERPHSSASILSQEIQNSNSPMPFKQSSIASVNKNQPSKMTLLERSKGSTPQMSNDQHHQPPLNQYHQNSGISPANHQRNQSYSRAMSVPVLSTEHQNIARNLHFETQNNPHVVVPPSPIRETVSPINEVHSPLTPSGIQESVTSNNEGSLHLKTSAKPIPGTKTQSHDDWANFSLAGSSQSSSPNVHEYMNYPSERVARSFSESTRGSTSSLESDAEEVWRITLEQREYYINQFKTLQPNTNELIKGSQARDFFLRSNLPNEILSKIWRLSDLDNDHALNMNEFCIAMHLVVAVRHGVELPHELPFSMIPQNRVDEQASISVSEDQNIHKPDSDEINTDESNSWSATFDNALENEQIDQKIQGDTDHETLASHTVPPSLSSHTTPHSTMIVTNNTNIGTNEVQQLQKNQLSLSSDYLNSQPQNQHEELKQVHSSTGRHSSISGVVDPAIARPRAQVTKNVNLMDSSPYQLLPPPSSKTKQKVKKSLTLDNIIVSKANSDEAVPSGRLLPIEQTLNEESHESRNDSNERIEARKNNTLGLSKEKSRSIDSLRSDISESSEFYWKRTSKPEMRPRSLTGESVSDVSVHEKEFEIPPTPPPRVHSHHARSSSLDLNQLLSTSKSSQSVPDLVSGKILSSKDLRISNIKPQKPPRINAPKQKIEKQHPGILTNQRRAFSDITLQKPKDDVTNKPLNDNNTVNTASKDKLVRFSKSPIEVQMRKHEIQERIETLKNRNRTLALLTKELNLQYKKVCEERIKLSLQVNTRDEDSIVV